MNVVRFTSLHHCLIMNDLPGLKSLLVSAELRLLVTPRMAHVRKKKKLFLVRVFVLSGPDLSPFLRQ